MITNSPVSPLGDTIIICGRDIILRADHKPLSMADVKVLADSVGIADHFEEKETNINAVCLKSVENLPNEYFTQNIRELFAECDEQKTIQYARARALTTWRSLTRFCGRCGKPLREHTSLTARECPECNNLIFPRIEPCVIVAVRKEGKILLARHVQRNQDIYACIAGFMEAGETVEQAVRREIKEETGINVKNVKYYGSQSWPFPAQLMLGFTADYDSGEITLQKEEISDAQWFDINSCPASPKPGSIAWRLIHEAF